MGGDVGRGGEGRGGGLVCRLNDVDSRVEMQIEGCGSSSLGGAAPSSPPGEPACGMGAPCVRQVRDSRAAHGHAPAPAASTAGEEGRKEGRQEGR